MEGTSIEEKPEQKWPSVPLAYDLAKPILELVTQRLNAVEARLQTVIGFAATVSAAVPVLASALSDKPDFRSVLFIAGVSVFIVITVGGIAVLNMGSLRITSPELLYKKYLHYSEWEFKKNILHFLGKDFHENLGLVNRKGLAVSILTALFLVETLLFVIWIARGIS